MAIRPSKFFIILAPILLIAGATIPAMADSNDERSYETNYRLAIPVNLSALPSSSTAITVSFNSVPNAASYTVRLYEASGANLIGAARTSFVSGNSITGLTPSTTYKVSVQAIAPKIFGSNFGESRESEGRVYLASTLSKVSSEGRESSEEKNSYKNSLESAKVSVTTSADALLPHTINFTQPDSMTVGDNNQSLTAVSDRSLSVTISSNTVLICTVEAGAAHAVSAGSCSLTASSVGNSTYVDATPVTKTFQINPAPTCATDITLCHVNSLTASGGTVFYETTTAITLTGSACGNNCHFLEVAPSTWNGFGGTAIQWFKNRIATTSQNSTAPGSQGLNPDEKANWAFGQGMTNTLSMEALDSVTVSAATQALAFAGLNSTARQWFLPSMNELNELCKFANSQTTGDFTVACSAGTLKPTYSSANYWSSSEYDAGSALFLGFSNGNLNWASKLFIYEVRPIRAF